MGRRPVFALSALLLIGCGGLLDIPDATADAAPEAQASNDYKVAFVAGDVIRIWHSHTGVEEVWSGYPTATPGYPLFSYDGGALVVRRVDGFDVLDTTGLVVRTQVAPPGFVMEWAAPRADFQRMMLSADRIGDASYAATLDSDGSFHVLGPSISTWQYAPDDVHVLGGVGNFPIFTMKDDGTDRVDIVPDDASVPCEHASLSFDGARVVYECSESGKGSLRVYDRASQQETIVAERSAEWPRFTPDGQHLVFADCKGMCALVQMDIATQETSTLVAVIGAAYPFGAPFLTIARDGL